MLFSSLPDPGNPVSGLVSRGGTWMARKRHSDEDLLKLPREIELKLPEDNDVLSDCRRVGISDTGHFKWRKRLAV